MTLPTIIGLAGVALVLLAYGLLSVGKLSADAPRYQWLNIVGTLGIIVSLLEHWNLPSFIAQLAWITVGVASLARIYWRRNHD